MTVLQGDIMRSEGEVRFQYASTVVRLPLLPREKPRTPDDIFLITAADVPDGWVNEVAPEIELPKNEKRTVRTGRNTGQMSITARF